MHDRLENAVFFLAGGACVLCLIGGVWWMIRSWLSLGEGTEQNEAEL